MHGTQPYLFYQTKIQIIKNKKNKNKNKGKRERFREERD